MRYRPTPFNVGQGETSTEKESQILYVEVKKEAVTNNID